MKYSARFILASAIGVSVGCAVGADAPQKPANPPATQPAGAAPTTAPSTSLSDVHINQEEVDKLQRYWDEKVAPHKKALQEAAEAHYKVIGDLRREQQRLIDEADKIQRTIDKLEKEYQDMTTPRPEGQ